MNLELQADLLRKSYQVALSSPDPSTQNGGLVYCTKNHEILTTACNDMLPGYQHDIARWHDRKLKYPSVIHAEWYSILKLFGYFQEARKSGNCDYEMEDLWLVTSFAACDICARVIAASGIKNLVRHHDRMLYDRDSRSETERHDWVKNVEFADTILVDNGVQIHAYGGKLGTAPIRHSGVLFYP